MKLLSNRRVQTEGIIVAARFRRARNAVTSLPNPLTLVSAPVAWKPSIFVKSPKVDAVKVFLLLSAQVILPA